MKVKDTRYLEKSLQKKFKFQYQTNRVNINEFESDFQKLLVISGIILFFPIWIIRWGLDNLFFWFYCLKVDIPFKFFPFTSFRPGIPFYKIGTIDNKIKIDISSDEHPPPHFHVYIDNRKYSFDIKNCNQINGKKLRAREFKKISTWYSENRELIIKIWNDTRPTNCSVGYFRDE